MLPVPDWPKRGGVLAARIAAMLLYSVSERQADHHRRFVEAADPTEFSKVRLNLGPADDLLHVVGPAHRGNIVKPSGLATLYR